MPLPDPLPGRVYPSRVRLQTAAVELSYSDPTPYFGQETVPLLFSSPVSPVTSLFLVRILTLSRKLALKKTLPSSKVCSENAPFLSRRIAFFRTLIFPSCFAEVLFPYLHCFCLSLCLWRQVSFVFLCLEGRWLLSLPLSVKAGVIYLFLCLWSQMSFVSPSVCEARCLLSLPLSVKPDVFCGCLSVYEGSSCTSRGANTGNNNRKLKKQI